MPSPHPALLSQLLSGLQTDPSSPLPQEVQKAIQLARHLQARGNALQTPQEKRQQRELELITQSAADKATLIQLTDQAFRSHRARRAAEQLTHILDVQGIPRFFSTFERLMLKGFQSFGSYLPGVSVPMVKERMRAETANVILPAEKELLIPHLEQRRKSGVRMNVNYLGEALLGEDEAQRRLEAYLAALQRPQIEVISVKISTIYSQISAIAREASVRLLCERLELLYRAAAKTRFTRADGTQCAKLVYLDMEEYRDLSITLEAFIRTLERPGLELAGAGIALQAYLPDSFAAQRQINQWARERVRRGGAPVTIRLVKGANMEMERVEASIRGWPTATFQVKADTDANYKRMLHEGLEPDNIRAVRLGVASHNLFDLSYALVLAHERGALQGIQLEMLEGMANHQRRALGELGVNLLLYAPATKREEFVNAIGYLVRRLDENAGPDNFLRHAFKLEVGDSEWTALEQAFVDSFDRIDDLPDMPRRTQDRNSEASRADHLPCTSQAFVNEPDTDFSLAPNMAWVADIIARWKSRTGDATPDVPVVVGGVENFEDRSIRQCLDPSRPGIVVGRFRQANEADLERALDCAATDPSGWRSMEDGERGAILAWVAEEIRMARGALIGAAMAEGGKIAAESDPEVSEAVDFVEYYPATARDFRRLPSVRCAPRGVVAVVSPWNFPIAIPCGGITAALAAGNTVILKPASQSVLVAWELCNCFWKAGVPREALQFLPCEVSIAAGLVASEVVSAVVLTGGTDTALKMLAARPHMHLLAETGGKNATIVTGLSDREQAIKHVLHSAFSHSGQKCSATSLLILEGEVYDDPEFKETLCDAVRSLRVGSAWRLDTRVGPLIRPPRGDLESALKELEAGESWAVMPHVMQDNPQLYSPAVKWDVTAGSATHQTELFGPVLAVMRAGDLDEAIEMVNQTGYGLTSGLESLDEREHAIWAERIHAGNLYINRVTTGAIVQRQPFGGLGKSAFGPGIKAGGPNYVAQLMDFRDAAPAEAGTAAWDTPVASPELESLRQTLLEWHVDGTAPTALNAADVERILGALSSYHAAFQTEFGREHDHARLVGQDNVRRYRAVRALRVRVQAGDEPFDIFARVCAAKTVGCHITVSSPPSLQSPAVRLLDDLTEPWGASVEFVEESDDVLAQLIAAKQTDRVRYSGKSAVPEPVLRAVGDTGVYIARAPVLIEGRVELLWYVFEQSLSHDYHRYGNLGARAEEERAPVK